MLLTLSFFTALAAGVLGFLVDLFGRGKPIQVFLGSLITNTLLSMFGIWLVTPDFSFFPGGGYALVFFCDLIIVALWSWGLNSSEYNGESKPLAQAGVGILVLVVWGAYMTWGFPGYFLDNAGKDKMAALFVVEPAPLESAHLPQTDLDQLIAITEETALLKASQSMGSDANLGSYLQPNGVEFQHVNGELVAPVDFRVTNWSSYRVAGQVTPGYILVSVEDANAPGQLVTGYEMKYVPGARWEYDLGRCVYFNYLLPNRRAIADNLGTLELDDTGKPYYTATTLSYAYGWRAPVPDGVIVVDPTNCHIEWYGLDELPAWLDIVWSRDLVEKYADLWATYTNWDECIGFCGQTGKQAVDEVNHVITKVDQAWQITLTSPNADQSAIGLIHFDPLTGTGVFYSYTGPVLTAIDGQVEEASFELLPGKGYLSEECEIHWLLGQYAAYCILVSHDVEATGVSLDEVTSAISPRKHGGYALLPVRYADKTGAVSMSQTTLEDAYNQMQAFIASVGLSDPALSESVTTVQLVGEVKLIGSTGGFTYFTLTVSGVEQPYVFQVDEKDITLGSVAAFTQVGHTVVVTAQQTPYSQYLVVKDLYNQTLNFPPK